MTEQCIRCGGPLHALNREEGLCSDNECFNIFLSTTQVLGITLPSPWPTREGWRAAYQYICREGHTTWPPASTFR